MGCKKNSVNVMYINYSLITITENRLLIKEISHFFCTFYEYICIKYQFQGCDLIYTSIIHFLSSNSQENEMFLFLFNLMHANNVTKVK